MSNITVEFWSNVSAAWAKYYQLIKENPALNLERVLNLITMLAGDLYKSIDFEITYGEINRVSLDESRDLVELYISPKLLIKNISLMELLIANAPKLPNLSVVKYRAYHIKDELIASIDYDLSAVKKDSSASNTPQIHTYNYEDFGCQWFSGVDKIPETDLQPGRTASNFNAKGMRPIINLVILVKKNAINLLTRKPVTFIMADGKEEVIEKWLPSVANVIDLFLINVIGEYNLVHNVGYIEFMPEDDPLIAPGSEFYELADLRAAFQMLNNNKQILNCNVCGRYEYQTKLARCSKCKKIVYCSKICQKTDFAFHKELCS